MSVILDALQKARGERQKNQAEPNPNSVARVLEPVTPAGADAAPEKKGSSALAVLVVGAMLLLLGLAGGGFYIMYQQMQRLQPQPQNPAAAAAPIVPPVGLDPGAIATPSIDAELAVSPGALPPPVPLSDLPIQPPAAASAASAANEPATELPVAGPAPLNASQAAVPQAISTTTAPAPAPEFKLGSIVCENNICMAIINGRTTRVGDRIKGYVISEITDKGVVLKSSTGAADIYLDLYN